RRAVAAAGLSDRVDVVTADMFADPWPAGHDSHLFSNVLHDWDEPDCRRLLALSAAALPPGGRVFVHDMLLDDDKAGPLWAAEYVVDRTRVRLGEGETVFRSAVAALRRWEQFRLGWVEAWPADTPLRPGEAVAVMCRAVGGWWLNACRVVYLIDETDPTTRFG